MQKLHLDSRRLALHFILFFPFYYFYFYFDSKFALAFSVEKKGKNEGGLMNSKKISALMTENSRF